MLPTSLLLTCHPQDQAECRRIIQRTLDEILRTFSNSKAYEGSIPQDLKKAIRLETLLPDEGLGFDRVLAQMVDRIFPNLLRPSSCDYMAHLHSSVLLESIAAELILTVFNQSMDSWDQSPAATEVELEVIRHLCALYGYSTSETDTAKCAGWDTAITKGSVADAVDAGASGTFTSGGTQSNLMGLLLARDWFCREKLHHDVRQHGLPDNYRRFRIYASEISHFSMEKSAHLLGLGYDAVVKVPVDACQKMDSQALQRLMRADIEAGNLPFCVVGTVGTTDYGSIDPIREISELCQRYEVWFHADAAYGSGVVMSSKYASRVAGLALADSITVDFHKMFMLPISCGVFLLKDRRHFESLVFHANYLNREEDEEEGYTNLVGTSLQTTRRFDALKVWISFQTRGKNGWSELITTSIDNAQYLYGQLSQLSDFEVVTRPEISSVVFRLNLGDDAVSNQRNKQIRRILLHQHGIVIGQTERQGRGYLKFTLLNPLITREKLDELIALIESLK